MSSELKFDQGVELPVILAGRAALMAEQVRYSLRLRSQDRIAFAGACKIDLPHKIGQTTGHDDQRIFCVGPDDYILIASLDSHESLKHKFKELAGKFIFSLTDISHRNVGFKISGKHAAQMINVGCPLDLSLEKFPVGKCTRTVFENAEIMIFREREDEFQLETWRSFAPYLVRYFEKFCCGNSGVN